MPMTVSASSISASIASSRLGRSVSAATWGRLWAGMAAGVMR